MTDSDARAQAEGNLRIPEHQHGLLGRGGDVLLNATIPIRGQLMNYAFHVQLALGRRERLVVEIEQSESKFELPSMPFETVSLLRRTRFLLQLLFRDEHVIAGKQDMRILPLLF